MTSELTTIKEIIQANAKAVYEDSAQPAIRVLGKSLAQGVSLFATPLGRVAEILENNLHRVLDKLEGLQEKDIVPPDTRILIPVLEKMRYIDDDKVADYYAEILATASRKEHASKVMVAFIEILNRLTADEIKILEYICSSDNKVITPAITEEEANQHGIPQGTTVLQIKDSLPIININLYQDGIVGFNTSVKGFSILKDKINFDAPDNINFYFDNMISLGLIEKELGSIFAIEKIYHHLENHNFIRTMRNDLLDGQKIEITHGRIDITDLGRKLITVGSPKK